MDTVSNLNFLAILRSEVGVIEAQKKALIDSVYTEEIRQKVNEIEAEFAPKAEGLTKTIAETESAIKAEVIQSGETAQGDTLEAVFTNGRTSWDTKGLDAAIKVLPQLEQFKKQGDPYVTIRARR